MATPQAIETVYKTSDGTIFTDATEAQEHQDFLNIKAELAEYGAANALNSAYASQVVVWMADNREGLKFILDGGDYTPPPPAA